MAEKLFNIKKRTEKCKELKEFLSISSKLERPRININK